VEGVGVTGATEARMNDAPHSSPDLISPPPVSFWRDRPVVVTGASGLVGGWVVRRLLAGQANVVCIVRDRVPHSELVRSGMIDRVTCVHGDICDAALVERTLAEYEADTVLHLAAQTIVGIANRNPVTTFESNIRGTWTLLEACRHVKTVKQVVVASSDKAYGDQEVLPYDENTPLQGAHPYDVSKSCSDLISATYANTYGLNVAITRCGNFFGGGDLNWNRLVPGTIRSILRGQPPVIRSDGQYVRDYFFADDGAAAYLLLAQKLAEQPEKLRGEAFNFSTEQQLTVVQLVDQVLHAMASDFKPVILNQACHEIRKQYLSAAKARTMLGWRPLYSMNDALSRTVEWYRRFFA